MNPALTSDRAFADSYHPLNKANYKVLQLLLVAAGLSEDRYSVLEPSCVPSEYIKLEKRKACWTQFYINALNAGVDVETLPDIQACSYINADDMTLA